jgi:hypothetical protein
LNSGSGAWRLDPGTYSVRVVYNLTREDAELARRMGKAEGVQVPEDALWVGRQLSEPVALEIK